MALKNAAQMEMETNMNGCVQISFFTFCQNVTRMSICYDNSSKIM